MQKRKIGCLPVLLLIVLVAVLVVWHLGYFDRWLYESDLDRAGGASVEELSKVPDDIGVSEAAKGAATERQPYVYSQLNEEDQRKYRIVLSALTSREDQPYPTDNMDDLNRIYQSVQADHPELFYVSGVSMETVTNRGSGLVERVTVRGRFAYPEEETARIEEQLKDAVAKVLAGIPADADDYGKAKYLYEWLATNVLYDHTVAATIAAEGGDESVHDTAQTVEGALLQGRAVCGGYASAFQYLMQAQGIQAVFVTGSGNGGLHAWCLVSLDGEYYYVDPTWADPQSDGGGGELGYVNFDYLNVTTAALERTHRIESNFPLPVCTATADNYYVREGLLFEWADGERLGRLAAEAFESGAQLQVSCVDEGVFWELVNDYVTSGRVGYYIPGGSYRYSLSEENFSIAMLP